MIETKVPKLVDELLVKEQLVATIQTLGNICSNGTECIGDTTMTCDTCLFQSTRNVPPVDLEERVDDLYKVLKLWSTISREGGD